jgi:hypothetical protein
LKFVVQAAREVAEEVALSREPTNGTATEPRRVLICPAHDNAEQAAAEMFAFTLDPARWESQVAGDDILASELLDLVAEFQPTVVLIVALPPGGLSHTRYLIARLRRRFPDVKLLIGRWGCEDGIITRDNENFGSIDSIDRTLADSRKRLAELHPLLPPASETADSGANNRTPVGTSRA